MLVKFLNFLNGRPELKIELTHLYKLKRYNGYNKNSLISPIYSHVPLKKNLGLTLVLDKSFLVRNYSILSSIAGPNESSFTDSCDREMKNFYAWFSGFTDAEGSFYIAISKICSFRFQINLHKDDLNVLYYIQRLLGFGEVRLYNNYASFTVTILKDIAQLINIFDKYPLQGSKWLRVVSLLKNYYHSSLKDYNCKAL